MEYKLKEFNMSLEVTRIANIHYFEFANRYHTFKDNHPFRELIYVDSGYITVDADSYSGQLSENQLIIHKAGETHSLTCPETAAPYVIIIGFECDYPGLDYFSVAPFNINEQLQSVLADIIKEGRTVFLPPYDIP